MAEHVKFKLAYAASLLISIVLVGCVAPRIIDMARSPIAQKLDAKAKAVRADLPMSAQAVAPPPQPHTLTWNVYDPIDLCTPEEQAKWSKVLRGTTNLALPVKQWTIIGIYPASQSEVSVQTTNERGFFVVTVQNTNRLWEFEAGTRKEVR